MEAYVKTKDGRWVSGGKDLKDSGAYTVRFVKKVCEAVDTCKGSLAHGKADNLKELFDIVGIEDRAARREHVTQMRLCFKKHGAKLEQPLSTSMPPPTKIPVKNKFSKNASIKQFMKPKVLTQIPEMPITPPPKRLRDVP